MSKACKAFGLNVAGFEHEIFDIILRMEEKRRLQLQKQKSVVDPKERSKKKQTIELERLKCGLNYESRSKWDRVRYYKAFSG